MSDVKVGDRVRITEAFDNPTTDIDKGIDVIAKIVGQPNTPENTIVGKLGIVAKICTDGCPWPVQVFLDDKAYGYQDFGIPVPFRADEVEVVR